MYTTTRKHQFLWKLYPLLVALWFGMPTAQAQNNDWHTEDACPGWNNPMSFTHGEPGVFFYQGRIGKKVDSPGQAPNVYTGTTGLDNGSGGSWESIPMIAGANMANTIVAGSSDHAAFPAGYDQNRAFAIYTSQTGNGFDPNTGGQLPYVPTHFNTADSIGINTNLQRSIRIGDAYGGKNATGLYYTLDVTSQNAMFYIYYACVIEAPGHGTACDPAFIIRVMKQNASGQWVQASPTRYDLNTHCDTLAYMVPSTPSSSGGTVTIGSNGWHSYTGGSPAGGNGHYTEAVYWKEWRKVSINLASLLYKQVRIEVMISDCCYTQHFAYAYICGECRPMFIESTGCPPGASTEVTTLYAPRGLDSYLWYASDYGVSNSDMWLYPGGRNSYFTFRLVSDTINHGTSEADNAYRYRVKADDFRVRYRPHPDNPTATPVPLDDSVGNRQTFRCTMTSALDPAKPFQSHIYTLVQNTKPTMALDTLAFCGGDVRLRNRSYVPGDQTLVNPDSTVWSFFSDPQCTGQPDSITIGESVLVHIDGSDPKGVIVRTNINEQLAGGGMAHNACYSEQSYSIRPLPNPKAEMSISKRTLCDNDSTTLRDISSGTSYRRWAFRLDDAPEDDFSLGDTLAGFGSENRVLTRPFSHRVEPIELTVRNGNYHLPTPESTDTTWCENTARDTVAVFTHPALIVTGDTIVCQGLLTDASVQAVGEDSCTYQWSTTPLTISGNLPPGPRLQTAPYADVSTYYVRVTSQPQGCVAWDSIRAYLVRPELAMSPADGRLCPGDTLRLSASRAAYYTWSALPHDSSLTPQQGLADIAVVPYASTSYTLVGHGSNGCEASPLNAFATVVPLPVPRVEATPPVVDLDDPVVILHDASANSVGATWTFSNGSVASGSTVRHLFAEATGADSVHLVLTTRNELGCTLDYPYALPVCLYTAWFPNIFTPGSNDANARFRLFSINRYEYFRIHIYNRRGELVYESDTPDFEWDGTRNGTALPQGTYVYVCRYRKPGIGTLAEIHGAVSLVR